MTATARKTAPHVRTPSYCEFATDKLIRHYTFNDNDLALIWQRRGDPNRLGFAVQMSLLRYPGQGLDVDGDVPAPVLRWIAQQLRIDPTCWPKYAARQETRREHLSELRAYLGLCYSASATSDNPCTRLPRWRCRRTRALSWPATRWICLVKGQVRCASRDAQAAIRSHSTFGRSTPSPV